MARVKKSAFIARHGLWTEEQRRKADELKRRVVKEDLNLVRLAWADPHGAARAKAVTLPAFLGALETGYNINVATTTLDSANARTFASFIRGGGMGLEEMTGSPNLTIVPDPFTFRVLPWAPGTGWVLCDEYFKSGVPFYFSPRHLLRSQLQRLANKGMGLLVGLEIEWYLLRVVQDELGEDNVGFPGVRGQPIKTAPAEPGFSYHCESNMDLMQPVLSTLADHFKTIGLPLRSIENEWGPGQLECTFAARPALEEHLSALGLSFLGGLLRHAAAATAFATPTVNGYRRFRPNSLAPDRVSWCYDHRGVMIRVLGAPGDEATRLENRIGEPAANPYLFILSQIVAGLDGIEHGFDPGPPEDDPYNAKLPPLPTNLPAALDALECEPLFRRELGDVFLDYFLKLKRNEAGRFAQWLKETGVRETEEPTAWEHNEYFDFF